MQISKNRYIDALGKLFLFSSIFHVGMLVVMTLKYRSQEYLNYFNILDLELFFPEILTVAQSQILSLILAGVIYGAILKWSPNKK